MSSLPQAGCILDASDTENQAGIMANEYQASKWRHQSPFW